MRPIKPSEFEFISGGLGADGSDVAEVVVVGVPIGEQLAPPDSKGTTITVGNNEIVVTGQMPALTQAQINNIDDYMVGGAGAVDGAILVEVGSYLLTGAEITAVMGGFAGGALLIAGGVVVGAGALALYYYIENQAAGGVHSSEP